MNAWADIFSKSAIEEHCFLTSLENAKGQQSQFLFELLDRNSGTVFGAGHNFAKISNFADFRNAVPIRSYEGFVPWIERLECGEQSILTNEAVVAFEETGGSFSGGKLIPYTESSLVAFRSAILPWLADLLRRRPGIMKGSIYSAISPATRQKRNTHGGIPVGLSSDAAYLGNDLASAFVELLAVPLSIGEIPTVPKWREASREALAKCNDLSFVSVWSPTFWLELAALFDPEQISLLWPQLDTISCWTDGPSKVFSEQLRLTFANVNIDRKGLLSTESAITIPMGADEGCLPALRSAFLEFIDFSGQEFLVEELTTGNSYRVVITTPGGLYRYDTGDVVKCVSTRNGIPRLIFEGRGSAFSDMVGEKISDVFAGLVLKNVPCAAMLRASTQPFPHYEIWFDSSDDQMISTWTKQVELQLRQNPQYAYARAMEQLKMPIGVSKPNFWFVTNLANRRLGDVKHQQLLPLQN
jgi:GH3 auxin-responsive promoter